MIILVMLSNGTRYAFVGDLVWQLEGITQREERPWITRRRADTDAEGNRENLPRIIALKERLPELIIVPAHDMRAFGEMPKLPKPSSMTPYRSKRTCNSAIPKRLRYSPGESPTIRLSGTSSHPGGIQSCHSVKPD